MTQAIVQGLLLHLADDPIAPTWVRKHLSDALQRLGADAPLDLMANKPGHRPMPFEAILGEIGAHTGPFLPSFLTHLFQPATPNLLHQAITALAARGIFDLVITTNFDECADGIWPDSGTVVVPGVRQGQSGGEVEVPTTIHGMQTPVLLKLHGTISSFDTVAATQDGLRKRATGEWQERLGQLLEGRQVLFVGYGFQDLFDLTPALIQAAERGATFCWADKRDRIGADLDLLHMSQRVGIDLTKRDENPLALLQEESEQLGQLTFPTLNEQIAHVLSVAGGHSISPLSAAQRLKAFAALYYWIEDGGRALRLFRAARELQPDSVDDHTVAGAYLRARRYRKAVFQFDYMLAHGLPLDNEERLHAELDWLCGAGFCASAGGRVALAHKYYSRATRLLVEYRLAPANLPPYLADQFLRGRAENRVRLAVQQLDTRNRAALLNEAEHDLSALHGVKGIELRIGPLIQRDLARIAILRGDVEEGMSLLETARRFFVAWGDPDGLATVERTIAAVDKVRRRAILADQAIAARRNNRWLEWVKLECVRFGVTSYGRTAFLQMRLRNLFVATWDCFKEAILLGRS